MTNILRLPLARADFSIFSNEDWLDSIAFFQADGTTALSLDGIAFQFGAVSTHLTLYRLALSTADGSLLVGGNALSWNLPASRLINQQLGLWNYDVLAVADGHQRVRVSGTLTIIEGYAY
jgi:hypothetical protein